MTTVDRIPVAALIQRFGKTKLYTQYLKPLGITPIRDGNSSYVTPSESELIDAYHEAKGRGKQAAEDFLAQLDQSFRDVSERSELATNRDMPASYSLQTLLADGRLLQLLEVMARHFAVQTNPLANLEAIERAYERGWLLSSSQLAPLLGVRKLAKSRIERFGFVFERVGRNGSESAWKISRV